MESTRGHKHYKNHDILTSCLEESGEWPSALEAGDEAVAKEGDVGKFETCRVAGSADSWVWFWLPKVDTSGFGVDGASPKGVSLESNSFLASEEPRSSFQFTFSEVTEPLLRPKIEGET